MEPGTTVAVIIGITSLTTAVLTRLLDWWRGFKKDAADTEQSKVGIENTMRDVYGQMVEDLVQQVERLHKHLQESDAECERRMARMQRRLTALEKHQRGDDL